MIALLQTNWKKIPADRAQIPLVAFNEELFRQAYYLYKAAEDESDRLLLVDDVRRLLGIEIE